MSQMEINQVLAQMRVLAAAAGSDKSTEAAVTSGADFGQLLAKSIDRVSETQTSASALTQAFERGAPDVDLPEVMVALQKANVSFQAITQVRNRLLSAYQDVMNMQV